MKNLFKNYETKSTKETLMLCGTSKTGQTKRFSKTYTK